MNDRAACDGNHKQDDSYDQPEHLNLPVRLRSTSREVPGKRLRRPYLAR
jgi:hypothetical protein